MINRVWKQNNKEMDIYPSDYIAMTENRVKWLIRAEKIFIVRHEGKIIGFLGLELFQQGKIACGTMMCVEPNF